MILGQLNCFKICQELSEALGQACQMSYRTIFYTKIIPWLHRRYAAI